MLSKKFIVLTTSLVFISLSTLSAEAAWDHKKEMNPETMMDMSKKSMEMSEKYMKEGKTEMGDMYKDMSMMQDMMGNMMKKMDKMESGK